MPMRGYEFYLRVFKRGHVIFCLSYKHTNNDAFDAFPKISGHFLKISEDFLKLFRRLDKRF